MQRPDLILMDIQLPVIDGYEATRRSSPIRRSNHPDHRRHVLCVDGGREKARDAGCDAYVAKPYSPRQLLGKFASSLP